MRKIANAWTGLQFWLSNNVATIHKNPLQMCLILHGQSTVASTVTFGEVKQADTPDTLHSHSEALINTQSYYQIESVVFWGFFG